MIPAALRGRRLAVVDVEGNGRHPPEIIEIAALPADVGAAETDLRTWLIRPATSIAALVTRQVHGISNADVADCPPWSAMAGEIAALLADRVLVAHHASVEHRVLGAHLPGWVPPAVLDTVRLAKHVWPDLAEGYGLAALIAHADLDPGRFAAAGHHRASYDTWCTWQLLCRLVEDGGLTWDRLLAAAALPNAVRPNEPKGLW